MKKVLVVFGTRPEAIKMCPVVKELNTRPNIQTIVCVTGQHRQMLDQVLNTFQIVPDYDLSIMKEKQTLFDVTVNILERIKSVLEKVKFTQLQKLSLHYNKISDLSVFDKTKLNKLQELYLDGNNIDTNKFKAIITKLKTKIKDFCV